MEACVQCLFFRKDGRMGDKVSCSYSTTGKIIVLYIRVFSFSVGQNFEPNAKEHFPNLI